MPVGLAQGFGYLPEQFARPVREQRPLFPNQVEQILPGDQFHHEVVAVNRGRTWTLLPAGVETRDDVWMLEPRDSPGFSIKTVDHPLIAFGRPSHDLDRDLAPQLQMLGAVDRSHSALAEYIEQAVVAENEVGTVALTDRVGLKAGEQVTLDESVEDVFGRGQCGSHVPGRGRATLPTPPREPPGFRGATPTAKVAAAESTREA